MRTDGPSVSVITREASGRYSFTTRLNFLGSSAADHAPEVPALAGPAKALEKVRACTLPFGDGNGEVELVRDGCGARVCMEF